MKQIIIMMGILSLVSISCTHDEIKEVRNGKAIDFRAAVETKGEELTTDKLESFTATAIDSNNDIYFQDLEFNINDENLFVSDPVYYWPASGSLTIYAYSPAEKAENVSINADTQTLEFTPVSSIKDQIDLVAIKTTGNNTAEGMALEFQHSLSQIQINAKNTNIGYRYSIKGVKIVNIASAGTFNFSSWDITDAELTTYQTTYDSPIVLDEDSESIMGPEGNAMLVPQTLTKWDDTQGPAAADSQTGSYLGVLINVTTSSDVQIYPETEGEYGWVSVAIGTQWLPGKKYIYILDFSTGAGTDEDTNETVLGEAIKFDVTTAGYWTNAN